MAQPRKVALQRSLTPRSAGAAFKFNVTLSMCVFDTLGWPRLRSRGDRTASAGGASADCYSVSVDGSASCLCISCVHVSSQPLAHGGQHLRQ